MTEEDEEFNRIEREASMRQAAVKATVAKREWVGLSDKEKQAAVWTDGTFGAGAFWADAKLKEKNSGK